MNALASAAPDLRVGSEWLTHDSNDQRNALLVGLFSRFNHDLRTPLNTIVGWTHLLQQGSVDASRSKHVADVLARNAREQTVLLEEFVDDGRAVLGILKPESSTVAVDDLINSAAERAAPVLSLHGVSLLPRVEAERMQVQGDEQRLQRLVYRLLVVMARRTREAASIEITAGAKEGNIELRIAAPVSAGDWSEAALLDLRISTFVVALHGGALTVDAGAAQASIGLSLPENT